MKRLNHKKGSVILLFSYFVLLIIIPLMAVSFDMGMMYIFRNHLSNLAQTAGLSCQAHYDNKFDVNSCRQVMAQVALLNINLNKAGVIGGTPYQTKDNIQSDVGVVRVAPNMLTDFFTLRNRKFFEINVPDGRGRPLNAFLSKNYNPYNSMKDFIHHKFINNTKTLKVWMKGTYHPIFAPVFMPTFRSRGIQVTGAQTTFNLFLER